MNNQKNKLDNLRKKIQHYEENKTDKSKNTRNSGASFGFKISTEIVAALVVGVGIGLVVDNYFETSPFGLIIFFKFQLQVSLNERVSLDVPVSFEV